MDEGLNALVFLSNESRRPDSDVVFSARPRGRPLGMRVGSVNNSNDNAGDGKSKW